MAEKNAAAIAKKESTQGAMQQKVFGKTIVFVETKREADELVSGSVFKSLTAQVCKTLSRFTSLIISLDETYLTFLSLVRRHYMAISDRNKETLLWLPFGQVRSMS